MLHYIINDHAGTPRELCTEEGLVAWRGQQMLWGEYKSHQPSGSYGDTRNKSHSQSLLRLSMEQAANDPVYCDLRYQGQIFDSETGLYYNRHRYYDPDSCQYLIPDPIGMAGGIRPSSYVKNSMEWVDPLRLAGEPSKKEINVKNNKTLPGPEVPEYHMGNYTDGITLNRQVSGDEVFYKYHGKENRLGQTHNYVTQKQYSSEMDLRNDLAILDEWGVDIDRITTFKPPKGTWVSEGTAAKQVADFTDEYRPGGGYQGLIEINNLPKSSFIRTDKLPEGFNQ